MVAKIIKAVQNKSFLDLLLFSPVAIDSKYSELLRILAVAEAWNG
jgi:hypothetical protein